MWLQQTFSVVSLGSYLSIQLFASHTSTMIALSTSFFSLFIITSLWSFSLRSSRRNIIIWIFGFWISFCYVCFDYYVFNNNLSIVSIVFSFLTCTSSLLHFVLKTKIPQTNPPPTEFTSGLISFITFSYITEPLIQIGATKESLAIDDLPGLSDADSCDLLFQRLCEYNSEKSRVAHQDSLSDSSFAYTLLYLLRVGIIKQGIFQFCGSVLCFVPPLSLQIILQYISNLNNSDTTDASNDVDYFGFKVNVYVAVAALFSSLVVRCLCDGQYLVKGR